MRQEHRRFRGIGQLLVGQGFEQVDESADADLVVVNTCGFIDAARQESIDTLVELGGLKRPGQKLLATGCLTERYSDEIAREIPEIDAIVARGTGPRCRASPAN